MNELFAKKTFNVPPSERQTKMFTFEIDPYLDFEAVKMALDVGSRDGYVAMEFREWFPNAKVHAFECDRVGVQRCRENLKGTDVELVEAAVCDCNGTANFNHVVGNPGTSSLLPPAIDFQARGIAPSNNIEQQEVQCLRLDTWLGERTPDVLWLDVQGAELPALRGLGDRLDSVKAVFVEAATSEVYKGQTLVTGIIQFMQEHGFRLLHQERYWQMEDYLVFVNSRLAHSGFPSYREWLASVAHPQDSTCRNEDLYRYAREKRALTAEFRPQKIVEIGVRLGCSAHAFLCGAPAGASYTGFDIVGGDHGGTRIAGLEYTEKILQRDFPKSLLNLVKMNTQSVDDLSLSGVDFFHVDGDHSTAGALHDMGLAWKSLRSGGVMVVDDYDWLPTVRGAVDTFLLDHAAEIQRHEYRKTFRGDVIMVKK